MVERVYRTHMGDIHYWVDIINLQKVTLVLLPGLTADHRLFDKQIECFKGKYNLLVWDAPGHAASWPFVFDFSLADIAKWLQQILESEKIVSPILVGQSMGGYVGQCFAEIFPEKIKGFIAIGSGPLRRKYITKVELWLLKRLEAIYFYYPWKLLLQQGVDGVAETKYGKELMLSIMMEYDGDKKRYSRLAGYGMKIMAEAIEADLPYELKCPALLIYGERDKAGSVGRYCRAWHEDTKIPLVVIKDAGHNANTDKPEEINNLIERFVQQVDAL